MKNNKKGLQKPISVAVVFIVSIVILTVLAFVVGVFEYYGDFASAWYFIGKDSILMRAIFTLYGKSLLFSVILIALFTVVRRIAKWQMLNQVKVYTLINVILGCFVSLLVVLTSISQANLGEVVEATKHLYDALNMAEPTVSQVITPFQIILCLHVGVFSAFVFLLTEKILHKQK